MKIKKGDKVIVISGKDKGKTGIVKEILPKKDKVIVEGINIRTHHVKPTQNNPEGGILTQEGPIHVSNLIINIGNKNELKGSRIGYKIELNKNGKKEKKRFAKKNGEII